MVAILSGLCTGGFSVLLFFLQGRRDRRRLSDAWQAQAEQLHQELSGQYQNTINRQATEIAAKDELIRKLINRDQPQ